ncbi:hypothetical protein BYT27DRAFT_7134435 [Phlegmacium glaucopus]|nr:hypothetical protein BYT27DRAFT_7134435 [Phlegmacium glaucopus]
MPATRVLPDVVEAIRQGHITSAQAIAVVAALFAGVQASLLSVMPDDTTKLTHTLILFAYAGLAFNIGASLSAMSLLDLLGAVPEQFWRMASPGQTSTPEEPDQGKSDFGFLISCGGYRGMGYVYAHCHISLVFGAFCLILQLALFAHHKSESTAVFVLFIIVCLWSIILTYPGLMIYNLFSCWFED